MPTLGEWWPEYLAQLDVERRKPSGQRARAFIWSSWLQPFAGLDLRTCCGELTIRRVRAHVAAGEAGVSPKRVNGVVGCLLTCLRYAARVRPELGLVVPSVKPIRLDPADDLTCYSIEQTAALLEHADVGERAAVLLMLDAGLRAGEVCALRWDALDLGRLRLDVVATEYRGGTHSPKSGKPRTVPITRRLAAALTALRKLGSVPWAFPSATRPGPRPYDTLAEQVRRLCDRAGVPRLGCHALRHTYATESLRAGLDLRTLQHRLGHADIATTAAYLHAAGPEDRDGVDALEARLTTRVPRASARSVPVAGSRAGSQRGRPRICDG